MFEIYVFYSLAPALFSSGVKALEKVVSHISLTNLAIFFIMLFAMFTPSWYIFSSISMRDKLLSSSQNCSSKYRIALRLWWNKTDIFIQVISKFPSFRAAEISFGPRCRPRYWKSDDYKPVLSVWKIRQNFSRYKMIISPPSGQFPKKFPSR